MKLYDLSFLFIFVKFQKVFMSKIAKLFCRFRSGLKWGPDPRLLHNHFDLFSLFFLPCLSLLNSSVPLSNNLRLIYWENIQVEPVGAGFFLCPHYTTSFVCSGCPPAWLRVSDGSVPSVCRPYQTLPEAAHERTALSLCLSCYGKR